MSSHIGDTTLGQSPVSSEVNSAGQISKGSEARRRIAGALDTKLVPHHAADKELRLAPDIPNFFVHEPLVTLAIQIQNPAPVQ